MEENISGAPLPRARKVTPWDTNSYFEISCVEDFVLYIYRNVIRQMESVGDGQ